MELKRILLDRRHGRRRGFSFTEILFAVMILGIGFIMVAAMFPVAIHQTEDSNRETIAAAIGRSSYSCLNELAGQEVTWSGITPALTSSVLLPTVSNASLYTTQVTIPATGSIVVPGQVWSFNDTRDTFYNPVTYGIAPTAVNYVHPTLLWTLISKNLIQATDSRFAWAAFYKRDLIATGKATTLQTPVPANFAQVIIVGVQSKVKPAYDPVADTQLPSTLFPLLVNNVTVSAGTTAGTGLTITFNAASPAVAEGAYVIISSDGASGLYNGRVYRLGPLLSGSTTQYYIVPGQGPAATDPTLTGASVYVVGRAPDPTNPGSAAGASQDVSVYSTFVQTP
jgi:type II secretory pathway pseudopilin PulG